jgi:glutathione S-transferase
MAPESGAALRTRRAKARIPVPAGAGLVIAESRRMGFVDVEEARATPGLRLVIAGSVPSPWSQGALGILDMKALPYVLVRQLPRDEETRRWTGVRNAPVALYDDEPPRSGWAEILQLAERLGGQCSLIPDDDLARVKMFGLAHEILGENGLGWCVRLLVTHAGLTTEGRQGWPVPIAKYLAPRYGYAPERAEPARVRACAVLRQLERTLAESQARGHAYLLGAVPSALDVYCAASLGPIVPMPEDACPMPAPVRHAFETLDPVVRDAVAPALLAHRALMFERHLPLPVRM